ncbi:MAG: acyl-[acyl-carrier-protein] desaturase [Acidimicrobiaceae bacterium]|nr:acyl-[acyl-carrier-protein] desaturase [Acidimicrobiaceae bacterium]
MDDAAFLADLGPTVERLFERHVATSKEWFPHQLVPWSQGEDFADDWTWDEDASPLPKPVRSALFVNLLTEDNLPYYFATISRVFGAGGAWGEWSRRWTAEEHRHSIVIRDWLTVTRAIDPVALERARMRQVSGGQVPEPQSVADGMVYVALQELATRISHRNTGKLLDGEHAHGYQVMARVAADENLHYLFYKDLCAAAIEVDPSTMVEAIDRQVSEFEMPGTGIPGFVRHAAAIAKAGIYDVAVHHDGILVPVVLRQWGLESLTGLTPAAERARDRTLATMAELNAMARKHEAKREAKRGGGGGASVDSLEAAAR